MRGSNWRNKRTGQTVEVPVGIDPGWDTNPGKNRARNLRRVQSRAVAGDEGEARAKDSEAVPSLGLGQIAQRAVALV